MKRSPMNRGSGAGLSRSAPMKRSTKPMAQRSKKQARVYAGDAAVGIEGRRDFVARILAERDRCEIGVILARAFTDDMQAHLVGSWRPLFCGGDAVEVHEVLRRSAGGSITDDDNVLATCRFCHRHTHEHPKESRELGLLLSRYSQPAAPEPR